MVSLIFRLDKTIPVKNQNGLFKYPDHPKKENGIIISKPQKIDSKRFENNISAR